MAHNNKKLSSSLREELESLQGERRARYLDNLLKEAILNVLAEQQQTPRPPSVDPNTDPNALSAVPPPPVPAPTPPPASPAIPPPAPPDPSAGPAAPPAPAAPPPAADPTMAAPPPAAPGAAGPADSKASSVTALVDSLNVIRGGKSLTDPEVLGGISTVFKSLLPEQKQELINILDMLSKAVAGTEQPAAETQGVPTPAMGAPPPPPAPPAPAPVAPPISPTGF